MGYSTDRRFRLESSIDSNLSSPPLFRYRGNPHRKYVFSPLKNGGCQHCFKITNLFSIYNIFAVFNKQSCLPVISPLLLLYSL